MKKAKKIERVALSFRLFDVVISEIETDKFLIALEKVCKRFAGKDWNYEFRTEGS